MKLVRFSLLVLLVATTAYAQQEPNVAAEHARLAAARSQVESRYKAEEKACYSKFAVNDCLAAAKSRRRQALEDVRRQEIALNEAERKRKAAERLRAQEERKAAELQRQEAAAREQNGAGQKANRHAPHASDPQQGAKRQQELQQHEQAKQADQRRREAEAAENVQQREKRLAEAQAHKEKQQKRMAERTKPPASSLATPP